MIKIARKVGTLGAITQRVAGFHHDSVRDEPAPYPGVKTEFTKEMRFILPEEVPTIPIYRVLNSQGKVINPKDDPEFDKEDLLDMYRAMVKTSIMDRILYQSQRQGRISFYMTNFGEEATQIGSARALKFKDVVFPQYREAGVFIWRGYTPLEMMHQCFGTNKDFGKGKQMPVHYTGAKVNIQAVSSPLGTQIPQAAGYAYAMKQRDKDSCAVCYFGEGAASEGDCHSAMNMAATLDCPILFFCRNNGYAISTATKDQYRGDGIASRGIGYGIPAIRFDGNDLFAVYNATKAARKLSVEQQRPVVLEAMTYRVGHHSTSDDSTAYRSVDEVKHWDTVDTPINRIRNYLAEKGWWDEVLEKEFRTSTRGEILKGFREAENTKLPNPLQIFDEVWDELPTQLQEQKDEFIEHCAKYGENYPLESFEDMK